MVPEEKVLLNALKVAIRLSKKSNRRLEQTLEISTGYLTRLLNGDVAMTIRLFIRLANALNIPPGNLLAAAIPPRPAKDSSRYVLRAVQASIPTESLGNRSPKEVLSMVAGGLRSTANIIDALSDAPLDGTPVASPSSAVKDVRSK